MVVVVGGGGGGGVGYLHIFLSRMDFLQIVYCMETQKFVVTTKWLQLSVLLYRNPKVVYITTTLTSS